MRSLVLVKYLMPEIEFDRLASAWTLGEIGRRQSELLATQLCGFNPSVVWCRKEPKAVETAEIVAGAFGIPVHIAVGLEEHHRDDVPFFPTQEEFEAAVESFFCKPDQLVLGTETAEQTLGRITAAIDNVIEAEQTDTVVITHATVMTLYLASVAGVRRMYFWRRLGLPSFVVLTLPEMQMHTIVESVVSE